MSPTRSDTSSPPRLLTWGSKESHSSRFAPTATSACAPTGTTWVRLNATPLSSKLDVAETRSTSATKMPVPTVFACFSWMKTRYRSGEGVTFPPRPLAGGIYRTRLFGRFAAVYHLPLLRSITLERGRAYQIVCDDLTVYRLTGTSGREAVRSGI